ncbi:MAG: STAS domain-containing protein [Rubrimonas sp.]|uniref:STAS domain-containing protein n=1 Tax=Rubrimonas sp. TaxID=2036015 RepID=UPI002FDCD755
MTARPPRAAARSKAAPQAAGASEGAEARAIVLPEALDNAAAAPLLDALRAARGGPLTLEAGGVRRLGGRCAQVLVSAALSWRADGAELRIEAPSTEFSEALRLLGFTPDGLAASGGKAS